MHCCFGALKRGALSHTFVWKIRIAVDFYTPVVEALTASESVNSHHSTKANGSASSRWVARFWMERMPSSRQTCAGAQHQLAFSKMSKATARAKRVRAYFVLLSNSAVSKLTRESRGAVISTKRGDLKSIHRIRRRLVRLFTRSIHSRI